MQSITKFKAIDGKEFNNENECLNYENLIKRVNEIMNVLPQLPNEENCNFLNGDGFIQHDKKILQKVRIELLEEIKQHIKHKWVQQTIDDENAHPSYVGRLIDEYQINPLSKAWHRFMCIDKLGREWGQPYFASNPGKGKQICVGGFNLMPKN